VREGQGCNQARRLKNAGCCEMSLRARYNETIALTKNTHRNFLTMENARMTPTVPTQPEPPTGLRNLFFVRRRPYLNDGIMGSPPQEWKPPLDQEQYQKLLEKDDFVSIPLWKDQTGEDLYKYPVIVQDLSDLDQHLLPTFFGFSTRSKFYQNRFYL